MIELPKYLPGDVIASQFRAGRIVSSYTGKPRDEKSGEPYGEVQWIYIIKSVDRCSIPEKEVIAYSPEGETEWERVER